MACTLRSVVGLGIFLAIIDIFHGLATLGFYGFHFVHEALYICPPKMPLLQCRGRNYIYEQKFEMRVFIGMGEGVVGVLFSVLYIIALIKRKPSLTWMWLLKSFAVIAINIYYLSIWLIRQGSFDHINGKAANFNDIFIYGGEGLTLAQIIIMVLYCFIGGIFTYKVVEERTASRRSLRHRNKWSSNDTSAPPLDNYDDEESQSRNTTLTNSEKTLPMRASKHSLTDMNREDTFKHSTGV